MFAKMEDCTLNVQYNLRDAEKAWPGPQYHISLLSATVAVAVKKEEGISVVCLYLL